MIFGFGVEMLRSGPCHNTPKTSIASRLLFFRGPKVTQKRVDARTDARTHGRTDGQTHIRILRALHNRPFGQLQVNVAKFASDCPQSQHFSRLNLLALISDVSVGFDIFYEKNRSDTTTVLELNPPLTLCVPVATYVATVKCNFTHI